MDTRRSVSLAFAAVAILAGCTSFPNPGGLGNATLSGGKTGGVIVSIRRGVSQAHSTQAAFADINEIIFSATLPIGGTNSAMIYKDQLANGVASASITDLPAGPTTVEADALDVSGNLIGSATTSANVVAGQMTTVDMTLQLVPTYIYATPAPTPTPLPTPTPPTGVQANLTILDGPTIVITPTPDPTPTPTPLPTPAPTPTPDPTPSPTPTPVTITLTGTSQTQVNLHMTTAGSLIFVNHDPGHGIPNHVITIKTANNSNYFHQWTVPYSQSVTITGLPVGYYSVQADIGFGGTLDVTAN